MLKLLKWVLVLPVAAIAMLVTQLLWGFISFPLNLVGGRYVAEFLMSGLASVAFVWGGSQIAPAHKTTVAFGLAAIMTALAVWSIYAVVSLPGFSLGATVVVPRPFGLKPETSTAWWQLVKDSMWALFALCAAVLIRGEYRAVATPAVTS